MSTIPKVERQIVCKECGKSEKNYIHTYPEKSFGHKFQPRRQTIEEAYYMAGFEDGYEDATSKAHWNSNGIPW